MGLIEMKMEIDMKKYLNTLWCAALLSAPFPAALAQGQHGAGHGDANQHMNQRPIEDIISSFESGERDVWQKPDEVVALLGDLRGKTVMDIGSGSGYFSFRLAAAGARVISADVDDRFLAHIEKRMTETELDTTQMELRHVPYDSANLAAGEADIVLIVDTYHHIENRQDYFRDVLRGTSPDGKLVIVDFLKQDLPVGPPVGMKLDAETIVEELRAAGYTDFEINTELLPYQYIIFAS
jgi:2-polyprenyl-3-methyl-5-hydroxy-6-metoxy-1,4-benzoquinol methylase